MLVLMHQINGPDEYKPLTQRTFLHLWQLGFAICDRLHSLIQVLKPRLQNSTQRYYSLMVHA